MKKTFWLPLCLGAGLGLLAGIATATEFSFLIPGTNTDNVIGFYLTLLLLSASLGGPLAGVLTSAIILTTAYLFGSPEIHEVLSQPEVFWPNLLALAIASVGVGFAYRFIFERMKMPGRLLTWAGIVIATYILIPVINISSQFFLLGEDGALEAILNAYSVYTPQAIFDILITSLVFIALPKRFRRPIWIERQSVPPPIEEKINIMDESLRKS